MMNWKKETEASSLEGAKSNYVPKKVFYIQVVKEVLRTVV